MTLQRTKQNFHYGTEERQRNKVIPGTMIKHHGRIYRASANVEKGLYVHSVMEQTIIKTEYVEILLNGHGEALIN